MFVYGSQQYHSFFSPGINKNAIQLPICLFPIDPWRNGTAQTESMAAETITRGTCHRLIRVGPGRRDVTNRCLKETPRPGVRGDTT